MSAVPKLQRLLNLVALLLKSRGPVSWDRDIKGRVEGYDDKVSDASLWRRFSRDKVELRALGIEVEHVLDDGQGNEGYRLDRSRYFLPALDFTQDEVLLLSLLCGMARDGEAALSQALSEALRKLRYAGPLPASLVQESAERYLFRPVAHRTPDLASNLEVAGQAIWRRQTLRFRYAPPGPSPDAPGERVVNPYGLGYHAGAWYLCGWCHARQGLRLFRLDRIKGKAAPVSGRASSGQFEIPDGFRMADHLGFKPWELGSGEPVEAGLRFDPEIAWMLEGELPSGAFRKDADGAGLVTIRVREPEALFSFLARFGPRARLLSPDTLRKDFRDYVGKVLALHREVSA